MGWLFDYSNLLYQLIRLFIFEDYFERLFWTN